jgi:hypothetical protein
VQTGIAILCLFSLVSINSWLGEHTRLQQAVQFPFVFFNISIYFRTRHRNYFFFVLSSFIRTQITFPETNLHTIADSPSNSKLEVFVRERASERKRKKEEGKVRWAKKNIFPSHFISDSSTLNEIISCYLIKNARMCTQFNFIIKLSLLCHH